MPRNVSVQSNATPMAHLLAFALGATAVGALAVGALAIGRVAIDRVAIRRARFVKLEVDELTVRKLHVVGGAAYLPVLKRFEDGSVRFRYMTLHKFRYYSIPLRDRFRPPVLL